MKYRIVVGDSSQDLSTNVNLHIADGWKLYGNVFTELREVISYEGWDTVTYFAQAMVKENE